MTYDKVKIFVKRLTFWFLISEIIFQIFLVNDTFATSSMPDNYIFANFYDYFARDTNLVRDIIQNRLADTDYPSYNVTKNTYDTIMNNSSTYSRYYYYIQEKTSSSSSYTIYLYTYAGAESSGTMNYYNISGFVCYTNVTYYARLNVPAYPNSGTLQLNTNSGTFNMPVVFYGQPLMNLFTTKVENSDITNSIKESSTAIQDKLNESNDNLENIDSSIQDTTNAVNSATNEISDMNDYLQDEDIQEDNVTLADNSGLDNSTINNLFSRLVNLISSLFTYDENSSITHSFDFGNATGNLDSLWTTKTLKSLGVYGPVKAFTTGLWCFVIGYYIYNDIRKIIVSFTDFSFMDKTINTDLL